MDDLELQKQELRFQLADELLHGEYTRDYYKKAFEDTLDSLNSQTTLIPWSAQEIIDREG